MVVLTERVFRFSLFISQLLAKAIPVRGAKFKKACFRAGFLLFSFRQVCLSSVRPSRIRASGASAPPASVASDSYVHPSPNSIPQYVPSAARSFHHPDAHPQE